MRALVFFPVFISSMTACLAQGNIDKPSQCDINITGGFVVNPQINCGTFPDGKASKKPMPSKESDDLDAKRHIFSKSTAIFFVVSSRTGQGRVDGFARVITALFDRNQFKIVPRAQDSGVIAEIDVIDDGEPIEDVSPIGRNHNALFKSCADVEFKANWTADGVPLISVQSFRECRSSDAINNGSNDAAMSALNSAARAVGQRIIDVSYAALKK